MGRNTDLPLWAKLVFWAGFAVGTLILIWWIWTLGSFLVDFIRWWARSFFNLGVWIYS